MNTVYTKHIIPIKIGGRPAKMSRIANSGEDGGFSYIVRTYELLFYSLYDFKIPDELLPLLSKYGNVVQDCNYVEWFPCGDEDRFEYDMDLTAKVCFFLNAYFNLVHSYYDYEFIPGRFSVIRSDWKDHGPIKYCSLITDKQFTREDMF